MNNNTIKPTNALARRATTHRRVANPGVTQLRKDADEKILKNSGEIAKALVEGATKGNASSARLLVDLAESANWTEHPDSVAQVISLAMNDWKKEPPTIELTLTTNPPKLVQPKLVQEDRRQLTGGSQIADPEVVEAEPES